MVGHNKKIYVSGTNLIVTIKKGSGLFGLDKLIITDDRGSLVREITPFGKGKRIIPDFSL